MRTNDKFFALLSCLHEDLYSYLKYMVMFALFDFAAVMQTDGFEYLKESCPHVLTELLEYVARINEHSVILSKQVHEGILDGSDVNGRRVKQRL